MTARELLNQFNILDESELDLPINVVLFGDDGFEHIQEMAKIELDPDTDQINISIDCPDIIDIEYN